MIGVPARAQAALPRGRWAPLVGIYPPPAPAGSPLEQLLVPPPPAGAPAFPALPTVPPPPPVVMESPAQGMQIGGGADSAPGWGAQPSIPSPNQNLASVVDAALTGLGMIVGGPMAMLGAIPAMAVLSTLENPQPTLGVLGVIGQLMGYPTVGQMVEGMLGGSGSGAGGASGLSPDQVAAAFALNDPWGTYDFGTDTWGGGISGDFSGIGSEAGSLAGSSTDSMGNPVI